jgi:hypothetical protein
MRIVCLHGTYQSEDGRYHIERGVISEGFCECPEALCPHPEGLMATYGWWIWDTVADDYPHDLGECVFMTYREARAALLSMPEPQPRPVRFPRPVKGETT